MASSLLVRLGARLRQLLKLSLMESPESTMPSFLKVASCPHEETLILAAVTGWMKLRTSFQTPVKSIGALITYVRYIVCVHAIRTT